MKIDIHKTKDYWEFFVLSSNGSIKAKSCAKYQNRSSCIRAIKNMLTTIKRDTIKIMENGQEIGLV